MQKIRIILAEDQELFRKSLIALLATRPEFEIVAEAANGKELIEHMKNKEADIVLLDIEMPVMDGRTALEVIKKRFPKTRVIILSVHSGMHLMSDFMSRGAASFLSKNCSAEILFKAIAVVNSEGYFFDLTTSKALLDSVLKDKSEPPLFQEVSFNKRETEILVGICDGKTNREMASYLNLSASTIDFHRSKIYTKTNCSNVTELLKYALRNGIIALT
jgi:DNA-binding NarL/FixJ family response regulator